MHGCLVLGLYVYMLSLPGAVLILPSDCVCVCVCVCVCARARVRVRVRACVCFFFFPMSSCDLFILVVLSEVLIFCIVGCMLQVGCQNIDIVSYVVTCFEECGTACASDHAQLSLYVLVSAFLISWCGMCISLCVSGWCRFYI
jgi:hypothetical protein